METTLKVRSERGILFTIAYFLLPAVVIWMSVSSILHHGFWIKESLFIAFYLLIPAFGLFAWFKTYYQLKDGALAYRAGFHKGVIPINSIRKIELNTWPNLGENYILAFRGLTIHFHRWDELYITPKNRELFIAELLKRNPEIEVIDAKAKTAVNS